MVEQQEFWVDLSKEEVIDKAQALANLVEEYKAVETVKKEAAKRYGDQLKEIRGQMDKVGLEIKSGRERRVITPEEGYEVSEVGADLHKVTSKAVG